MSGYHFLAKLLLQHKKPSHSAPVSQWCSAKKSTTVYMYIIFYCYIATLKALVGLRMVPSHSADLLLSHLLDRPS